MAQSATILTIGNEILCGDVSNTNGTWLARRLEGHGVRVRLVAAIPDEIERIVEFIRVEAPRADVVVVTGGLGGTPDDITREGLAAAFSVSQVEVPELAADLRRRFSRAPEYAARWALLPAGSRPLRNPLGGAPGFAIENVYVLPGLPSEMEAMFDEIAGEIAHDRPIASWRRTYATRESDIVEVLQAIGERYPGLLVGSYPSFHPHGSKVEVVVKSGDPEALAAAVAWIEAALDAATR